MNIQLVKLIARVSLLSAMVVLTSVASAHGQSLGLRSKFNVPFDFAFGETKFTAGKYSVGRAMHGSDDVMVSISDLGGRSKAIVLSNAVITSRANTSATLVFHRYGDEYFLVEVWPAGGTTGRAFPETKRERSLHRQLAKNTSGAKGAENASRETVTVAAILGNN